MSPMPTLEEMLPQADPMILLSDYEEPVEGSSTVVSYVDISERSPFYDCAVGGTPSVTALEYMAQTMALCVGFDRRRKGLKPKLGFVLGSRRLEVRVPCFRNGERYRVVAECTYTDDEFGSFDCGIYDSAGVEVAKATVTAFQPDFETTPDKLEAFT